MTLTIDRDLKRFKDIVRGRIRKDLRKYMGNEELIIPRRKGIVSLPLPRIEIPHFRHDTQKAGGVGQGDGVPGTPIGVGEIEGGTRAGDQPGAHILEIELSYDELADIMGEALELPRIRPVGKEHIHIEKEKYSGITRTGPETLRHFKRTYREALKRMMISGEYNPEDPYIIPIREDKRYRTWELRKVPIANAVIIYTMDVSGSMGFEQKEIVRLESFWIDLWIRRHYRKTETVYIVHDAVAHEVDRDTFFHIREGGGTRISSAYKLTSQVLQERFPAELWNIYIFQFSDGDNWNGGDTDTCLKILQDDLLPKVNLFCYGQVKSAYGSGDFFYTIEPLTQNYEQLILSHIESKDQIYDSIKAFLGKGR